jgi:hypothetical protein
VNWDLKTVVKKMNKELKLLLFLAVIIGGIIFVLKYPQYKTSQNRKLENKRCCDEIENQYFGVVDSVVASKIDYFFFKKKIEKRYLRGKRGYAYIRYTLKKGDSIVKKRNESRYIIYKNAIKNDSIILDFECK